MIQKYPKDSNVKAIATVVLMLAIIYFIIRPITVNTYSKYIQVRKYTNDIAILEKNLDALSTIKRITKDYETEIKLVEQVIPQESREKDFIRDLSILCGRNQVNLTTTEFTHFADNIVFRISLEGRYENATELLKEIDNMLRLTNLETLAVTSTKDGPSQGTVIIEIGGKIFKKASNDL